VAWGLLFGSAYAIAQPHLPAAWSRARRSALVALCSLWAVGVLPFLKYPANPPGVGDPDTIDFRQRLYLTMLILGIVAVAAAFTTAKRLAPRLGSAGAGIAALAVLAVISAAAFFGLPDNPDAIRAPFALVQEFRLHSLAGIVLFWLLSGAGLALALPFVSTSARSVALRAGAAAS
jgi:hypothetical protein